MRLVVFLMAGATLCALAGTGYAECGDARAVADARAQIDAECACDGAATHGAYVRCAAAVASTRVRDGLLPRACRSTVKRCAARSTCGKRGFVTCCRTKAGGTPSCSIRRDASACQAPSGGTAAVGSGPSCCDACAPTTTSSTTTTLPTTCGNHVVDDGEVCDEGVGCPGGFPVMRCARLGENGSCQRCCGAGIQESAGAICAGRPPDFCCGHCAMFAPGNGRCVNGTCGNFGALCGDGTCCPGLSCGAPMPGPPGFRFCE
jgi:hypothetical protein